MYNKSMAYLRMKRLAMILSESNGKLSVASAMKEAGYSISTAHNPQQVTKSKSWKELIDEFLPESMLIDKLKENIKQKKSINASNTAMDMAFKIRGKYQKEKDNEEDKMEDLDTLIKENEKLKSKLYAGRIRN
jgi:hypothetical protein